MDTRKHLLLEQIGIGALNNRIPLRACLSPLPFGLRLRLLVLAPVASPFDLSFAWFTLYPHPLILLSNMFCLCLIGAQRSRVLGGYNLRSGESIH